MDRHIGIRQIFNPDENFDPDRFDDKNSGACTTPVQRRMITDGTHWLRVPIPVEDLSAAVRKPCTPTPARRSGPGVSTCS